MALLVTLKVHGPILAAFQEAGRFLDLLLGTGYCPNVKEGDFTASVVAVNFAELSWQVPLRGARELAQFQSATLSFLPPYDGVTLALEIYVSTPASSDEYKPSEDGENTPISSVNSGRNPASSASRVTKTAKRAAIRSPVKKRAAKRAPTTKGAKPIPAKAGAKNRGFAAAEPPERLAPKPSRKVGKTSKPTAKRPAAKKAADGDIEPWWDTPLTHLPGLMPSTLAKLTTSDILTVADLAKGKSKLTHLNGGQQRSVRAFMTRHGIKFGPRSSQSRNLRNY